MKILFTVFFDPKDLGARYLSAYMEKVGHETRIMALKTQTAARLIAEPEAVEIENSCFRVHGGKAGVSLVQHTDISAKELELLTRFISDWKPDIVGFGTRSMNFKYLPRIIPAIRAGNPEAFLIAGGFGPSFEPEIPLQMGVDAVIRGEGEYILSALADRIASGKEWNDLAGVAFMNDGKPKINKIKTIERNLDNFPFPFVPDNKIFVIENDKLQSFQDQNKINTYGKGSHLILSTRGCPAECSYCGGRALRNKFKQEGVIVPRIRRRSLANVLEELKLARQNPDIRQIIFSDEYFIHPIEEMISFFNSYRQEVGLPFHALMSPEQIAGHPDMLDAAISAGLMYCTVGLQTGNEAFCRQMYNRKNDNSIILKAINMAWDRGMSGWIFMILGNPLEEARYIEYTLDLIAQMPKADPSFKRRLFFETNKLRIPYGNPPILRNYPELRDLKVPGSKFYYDAMMLEFRLLLNDDDFRALRADKIYKSAPHLLGKLYQDMIEQRHLEYVKAEMTRLAGMEVYVYGGGLSYEQHSDLLKDVKIRNFLVDPLYKPPLRIDGITVLDPADKSIDPVCPVIVMSGMDNINPMSRRIKSLQPEIRDIVSCSASSRAQ